MSERLWVRMGDADSYNDFDDFDSLADYMTELSPTVCGMLRGWLEPRGPYQFEAPGFENQNCISLYWGDKEAQPVRELTETEISELELLIEERLPQ